MNDNYTNVPVFLIFFNRPDTFKKVFNVVKEARPKQLFLVCDGARTGREDDEKNISACKRIAEQVDWDCEVHKRYSDINLGCGMNMYSGIKWAFEYVDRLMILEDDCVPSMDFFPFCEELLEKYKDDQRISMISAMNHLEVYKEPHSDYFFSGGCCWGWATWKRVWDDMDYTMDFLKDGYAMKCVEHLYPYYSNAIAIGQKKSDILKSGGKLSAWTYQAGISAALNNQISIIPTVNLVTNIGLTADSEHATNDIKKLPKKTQAYFNMPTHKLKFPLKHPKYVIEDRMYYHAVQKKFKISHVDHFEGIVRQLIFAEKGDIKKILGKVKKKLHI